MTAPPDLLAVVVAHNPGPTLAHLCSSLANQCEELVVDNASTSGLEVLEESRQAGARVVRADVNTGVAGALATAHARAAGREWLLTFDQDSVIDDAFVASLVGSTHAQRPEVGMVGPVVRDAASGALLQAEAVGGARYLITSGALCRVRALDEIGGFRTGLFIDHVDTDACLRLRGAGWALAVDGATEMRHTSGGTRRHGVGGVTVSASHHSADRHYYRYRNFVLLVRDGTARADGRWARRVALALAWGPLKVLAFEDDKGRKLASSFAGVRDGLAGRSGPRPDSARASARRRSS